MAQVLAAANALFRDRDLFIHDGSKLRRFRVSAPIQAVFFADHHDARRLGQLCDRAPGHRFAGSDGQHRAGRRLFRRSRQAGCRDGAPGPADRGSPAGARRRACRQATSTPLRFAASASIRLREGGRGGPFETAGNPTFKALFNSWKKLDSLQDGVISVPSDKPVKTAAFTSGYGVRADPFRGAAAMHAGIDLSGPVGTPIYATADGVVTTAELEQRRLRQPRQDRSWPRHRDPLRPPFLNGGSPRRARHSRPGDRPHGLDRPLDRQPPALRSAHRRPRREPDPVHEVGRLRRRHAEEEQCAAMESLAIGGPAGK